MTRIIFFFLVFVLTSVSTVYAQAPIASPSASAQASESASYQLPFPGLLPDHPLYIFKTVRDRIIDILIGDPVEKTRFYITSADKRLSASIALVDKGKPQLAETTASKGEEYLARAVASREQAAKEGKDVSTITTKLMNSLNRHESALLDLATKTEGGVKDRFTELSANARQYRESVQSK